MSVDMFTYLNNDILQCILYEWLEIKDICQLDIAVCNHSVRPLYYEALQSSISPLNDDALWEITVIQLYEILKWSKKREIKNPIQEIYLIYEEKYYSSTTFCDLAYYFKSLRYTNKLSVNFWEPMMIYALGSLQNLTSLTLINLEMNLFDHALLGLFLKQFTLLEELIIMKCPFESILISILSEIPSLKSLEVYHCYISKINMNMFEELSQLPHLERIELGKINLNSSNSLELSSFSTLIHLKELILSNCNVSIEHLLTLTQLTTIKLESVTLEEENHLNYENYLPFHQLESFISNGSEIPNNFLQFIFRSKQLNRLIFRDESLELLSSSFYMINKLSQLTYLLIEGIIIDEHVFDSLCQLSQLEYLHISGAYFDQINKQNLCFPFSKLSKRLIFLNISYQSFIMNKKIFSEISQLYLLIHLSFSWDSNSLEELQPLSELKQLISLQIHNETTSLFLSKEEKFQIKEILQLPKLFSYDALADILL